MKIATYICIWFSVREVLSLTTYYCETLYSKALHVLKFVSFCKRSVLGPGYVARASIMIFIFF